jgi:predicted phosphodiesterase
MARLLITADLHYDHPRSRPVADDLIDRMNVAGGDVLLVVGDTATSNGDAFEQCLSRFQFAGPKLVVAGNHELWTRGPDSYEVFTHALPRRARELGWHWLEDEPLVSGDLAIVGSVGWYDYSFAPSSLGIPRRFYEHKLSPGAAERLSEFAPLLEPADDVASSAREVVARWNDGKFVKLGRSDEVFLTELLNGLEAQLTQLAGASQVIAAIHHLPFKELLPPLRAGQWDFAKAFLGSGRIGEVLLRFPNVRRVFCGHSHFPAEAHVGPIHAVNVGSGYRHKTFLEVDVI